MMRNRKWLERLDRLASGALLTGVALVSSVLLAPQGLLVLGGALVIYLCKWVLGMVLPASRAA